MPKTLMRLIGIIIAIELQNKRKCHLTYFSGWFANKTLGDLFFVIFKVGYFL
jgi:hypothetical protein